MAIEFTGVLVIVFAIFVGLVVRAYSGSRVSVSCLIVLHVLASFGLIIYSVVLEMHGREIHALGKDLGRIQMYGELCKAGIDVPSELKPSVSKGRLVGPSVDVQIKTLAIFWPSVLLQCYVFLVLVRYRKRHSQLDFCAQDNLPDK